MNTTAATLLASGSRHSPTAGEPALRRTTFRTSRLMDFASRKELVAQTSHQVDDWPLVVLKELLDNALDACEDARIAPVITVTVADGKIIVADNGPGIPTTTIDGILDFSVRVSSREAYVAPDRGKQGNALKTLACMPFVLEGNEGSITLSTAGIRHSIAVKVDRIRQEPVVERQADADENVKSGTQITIDWPDSACSILESARSRFLQIAEDYTVLNPHLTLTVRWDDQRWHADATNPTWTKWRPSDPTSAHWYLPEHLERLIAAYVTHDADAAKPSRTVRELLSEFRGISGSGTQKRVLDDTGLARVNLADLVHGGQIDADVVNRLLHSMQLRTKPVKPAMLGIIGEDHLRRRLEDIGCAMETFNYRKVTGETDGLPWVIETAFAALECAMESTSFQHRRRLITGVNWSPGIINPFRELGRVGESLDSVLSDQEAGASEPVALVLHLACPRVEYMDRGKSSIAIGRCE